MSDETLSFVTDLLLGRQRGSTSREKSFSILLIDDAYGWLGQKSFRRKPAVPLNREERMWGLI